MKLEKKRVYVDMDNVLVDFQSGLDKTSEWIMGTVPLIHFYTPLNVRYSSSQRAISGRAACLSLKGQKR